MLCLAHIMASGQDSEASFRAAFYNVENFFDTVDDSLTRDDDYTPEGSRAWTDWKYKQKRNNIYKVIAAIGEWKGVDVIGLAEIENRQVLDDLVSGTPLSKYDYGIIHAESPDRRGIDVALLYKKSRFEVINKNFIEVTFPFDSTRTTRDILHTTLSYSKKDTLHFFVNHWPSRWGGEERSRPNRLEAAKKLRKGVDSVLSVQPNAKIVIMGDFNDTPENISIMRVLHAHNTFNAVQDTALYNVSAPFLSLPVGTYKYQGHWNILDQIIISGSLLNQDKVLYTTTEAAGILQHEFLFTEDEKYTGKKPFRTYYGYKWQPGFSDHLPVYIDFFKR